MIGRASEAFEPARFAIDAAGRIQGWNPAAERLLGYAAAEASGLEASRLFQDPEAPAALRERASREGLCVSECALVARSGAERPALVVATSRGADRTLSVAAVDGSTSLVARVLLENTTEAAIVSDAARAVVIAANRRACEIFGRTPEEFADLPVYRLMPPAIGPDMAPRVTQILDETGLFQREGMTAARADGTTFLVDLQVRRVRVAGRRYSLATFRDVKERARAEEFQRVLFEQARDALYVVDVETFTIVDVNETAARQLGYSPEELRGRPVSFCHAERDAGAIPAERERLLREGGGLVTDMHHRRKDGTEFPVEIMVTNLRLGDRPCFVGAARDVSLHQDIESRLREAVQVARRMEETARRQAAELTEAKGFLEALQENALDGISVQDATGRIIYCNSQGAAFAGRRPEQLVGQIGWELYPPEQRPAAQARFRRAMEQGEPLSLHTTLPAPGGGAIELDVKSTRVLWGGRPYMLSIVRDVTERVRTERELAEAKGLMEAVQESATDAIFLVDSEGVIVSANSRALEMMNRGRAQVVGRHFNEFSPPGMRAEREMVFRRVLAGEPQHYRTSMHPPGREPIVIDTTSNRVTWSGRAYVFSVVRDVSAQVRAQERLELYRQIIANTNEGVGILDTQGCYVEQNAAHERLLGYPTAELAGRTPAVHLVEPHFEAIATPLARDGVYHGEVRSRTKRGAIIDIELSAFAVRDGNGEPVCFVGIKRDITERKRAARRLAAQHAATRIMAEAATLEDAAPRIVRAICECLAWDAGAVWSVDRGRRALCCAEFWHVPAVEVREFEDASRKRTFERGVGLPGRVWSSAAPVWIPDVVRDADSPRARDAERAGLHAAFGFPIVLDREVLGVIEFLSREIRPPDDDLLTMMAAVGSQIGQFIERRRAEADLRRAMQETRRAYARLKRTQEQLVRSERLASAGMLLSGVAHEINNPINVILGNLKLLQARCARLREGLREGRAVAPLVRPVPGMLADALQAAENAHRVIAEFRAFARDPSLAETADITACVEAALATLAPEEMARVRVVKKLARLPAVRCVPGQVQHAVRNLVKNALEAMNGRGTLTLTTSRHRGYVRITVADTGRGIPKADLERVFEPFYTTKAEGRGLGLGLPICVTIAQNHRGRLTLRARRDRGTTAVLELAARG